MKSSWIRLGSNSHGQCPHKRQRRREHTDTGEGPGKTKGETGADCHKPRNARSPEAGR